MISMASGTTTANFSMPGCSGVSCLRSHINMTETINSLSMITKAGVPSRKVVVGVSSYGRSFQMTKAGCTGPQCGFTGPDSTAKQGRCTSTNGYISNGEIDEILKKNDSVKLFTDDSETQILVYDSTQWVAYMDDNNKAKRKEKWTKLNFAGTTDWAVDLATFTPGDDNKQCWLSKHCQSEGATDTSQDSEERWKALCSDQAWDSAMKYWKDNKDGKEESEGFSRAISNFFHGTPSMDCDVLSDDNGCKDFEKCLQGDDTGPAATFVLNGFVTMSSVSEGSGYCF